MGGGGGGAGLGRWGGREERTSGDEGKVFKGSLAAQIINLPTCLRAVQPSTGAIHRASIRHLAPPRPHLGRSALGRRRERGKGTSRVCGFA